MTISVNEVFALREGERTTITADRPASGRWLAVQARTVSMPEGPRSEMRHPDGAHVEQLCVIAAQLNRHGLWQWVYLSPATKEQVGDLMLECACEADRWYYAAVESPDEGKDALLAACKCVLEAADAQPGGTIILGTAEQNAVYAAVCKIEGWPR